MKNEKTVSKQFIFSFIALFFCAPLFLRVAFCVLCQNAIQIKSLSVIQKAAAALKNKLKKKTLSFLIVIVSKNRTLVGRARTSDRKKNIALKIANRGGLIAHGYST